MLQFSDEVTQLCSSNASLGSPRIIVSPEAFDGSDAVRLQDVVVTHLYKWNPEALEKFLDLHRGKFEYVLERPSQLTLLIARLGQKIQVSAMIHGVWII